MSEIPEPGTAAAASPPAGNGPVKPGYDPGLVNEDLAPLKRQTWTSYDIFAFWMSDVHSVGGYITAGSLFALGLNGWQVLTALLAGILIVQACCNLVARPSQLTGTPFPVVCRLAFGVHGANIPALVRGAIAMAWYGIQTYLASGALLIAALKLQPQLAPYADVARHGFAGLSTLGWCAYLALWAAQAAVFWRGMESIRRFIDWSGPAVYVVMAVLAGWLVHKAGWSNIGLSLSETRLEGWHAVSATAGAVALVVTYFSGPMLNFGDFSRYARTMRAVRRGNAWGLPVNFLFFSLLTVVTIAATRPVFGRFIHDPVETIARIDSTFAVLLGSLTFVVATVGINIVANFVSPAFDLSNAAPQRISWHTGGMIAAIGSVLLTPWNIFDNPLMIHYTLDVLGAFVGPLFGILVADYYLVRKRHIVLDDLFTRDPGGAYWYRKGYNPAAIKALVPAVLVPIACVLAPDLRGLANYSWFIGMGMGTALYTLFMRQAAARADAPGTCRAAPDDAPAPGAG
ncbi:NCS1 family nucleobase:cation symporter-1 [Achromobacter aloeverae]